MLNTNCESLRAEIMDVLRAFNCENEDFNHYFSFSCGKLFNSIEYGGKFYDFEEECTEDDPLKAKRLAVRSCKLSFYKVLSPIYGGLAWGALTGIRPTKLAYTELQEGRDFKPLFQKLCVPTPNISLIERVLAAQQGIYAQGGCDLFIGIPFCPSKCEYCSFITAPIEKTRGYVDDYVKNLVKEIYSVQPYLENLRSVYIGGGTPFVFDIERLTPIYAAINAVCKGKFEYTVEAGRPDVFTKDKLALSKDFGVTRICVNPQTFNDKTLQKIGRLHTAAQTLSAYSLAQSFGFDINLDLIAGLADETVKDFEYSLDTAISLQPANVTVHTLSLKSGAKLKENVKRLSVAGIEDMINLSREKLTAAGYEPYYLYRQKYQAGGLENVGWAKRGKACVYNVDVMEETSTNVAVGANAITKRVYGQGGKISRYAAPKDIVTYLGKIEEIISRRNQLLENDN